MAFFLTFNVNGLRDPNKRMAFLQWLSNLAVDFVYLQETHFASSAECDSWFSSFGFLTVASPGSVHSCGTVILFQPKFELSNSAILVAALCWLILSIKELALVWSLSKIF